MKSETKVVLAKIGKYYSFKGRANRVEFLLAGVIPWILFRIVIGNSLFSIVLFLMCWISLAVAVRRARDCGITRRWLFIIPVPLLFGGAAIVLVWSTLFLILLLILIVLNHY